MPCKVCGYDKVGYGRPHSCADHLKEKLDKVTQERDALLEMTRSLDEHPEDYDGPCQCRLCLSYVDCEGLDFDRGNDVPDGE